MRSAPLAAIAVILVAGCGGTQSRQGERDQRADDSVALQAAAEAQEKVDADLAELAGVVQSLEIEVRDARRTGRTDWCGSDLDEIRARGDNVAPSLAARLDQLTLPAFEEAVSTARSTAADENEEELTRLKHSVERARQRLDQLTRRAERGADATAAICR